AFPIGGLGGAGTRRGLSGVSLSEASAARGPAAASAVFSPGISSSLGSATDTGRHRRTAGQPVFADRLPAAHANAVTSRLQPAQRRVDLGDPLPRLPEQRRHVL